MSLVIAYTNQKVAGAHAHTHSAGHAKTRFMKRIVRLFGIGSEVSVKGANGHVIGYNISEFGRWLSISHPVIVQLDTGEIIFSPSSELEAKAIKH